MIVDENSELGANTEAVIIIIDIMERYENKSKQTKEKRETFPFANKNQTKQKISG